MGLSSLLGLTFPLGLAGPLWLFPASLWDIQGLGSSGNQGPAAEGSLALEQPGTVGRVRTSSVSLAASPPVEDGWGGAQC